MQRRSFLKKASVGAVAGTATVAAPVFAQDAPTLNWTPGIKLSPQSGYAVWR